MSDYITNCRTCGTNLGDVELLADGRCATCLQAEIERMRSDRYNAKMFCQWAYDESHYKFDTACGHAWQFIDGDVAENGVSYCPFCGGRITESKAAGGDDGDGI